MNKPKYKKPLARSLSSFSGAEGACVSGGSAYGTTCTLGDGATGHCSAGTSANVGGLPAFCTPGASAANCISGATAGG